MECYNGLKPRKKFKKIESAVKQLKISNNKSGRVYNLMIFTCKSCNNYHIGPSINKAKI